MIDDKMLCTDDCLWVYCVYAVEMMPLTTSTSYIHVRIYGMWINEWMSSQHNSGGLPTIYIKMIGRMLAEFNTRESMAWIRRNECAKISEGRVGTKDVRV